ncbi:MAG TPA: 2-oxoglutarate dehydrogenase complex dihydrolipoyllysine-residue succinyltransferase [Polyangiaceae bacterium]
MAVELKVPPVGESITEVVIGDWLKSEGDAVARDEVVAMIETDKVTVELPAPTAGVISKILIAKGQAAAVGDVIGLLEEGAADGKEKAPAKAGNRAPEPKQSTAPQETPAPKETTAKESEPAPEDDDQPVPSKRVQEIRGSLPPQAFARVMPSARRALREKGLRVEDVEATGPGGRILKEDVMRTPARPEEPAAEAPAPAPARDTGDRLEEVVTMTPMRKRIAQRLVESQSTAALLTTFNEIDMSGVMALRKQYQASFQEKYGIKVGFMSFFVKAAVDALKLIPQVNAEIRGNDIVYKQYYDIGVAIGGGKGLVVPVIRNAERLSFAEVEQVIAEYGKRAQANKLKLDELQGGTFTLSNGGIYGSLLSTPIVNPPQSGILGMHAIQERPVVRDGQIVIRPMMYVALTYDHRLVDGREAVTFLKRVKECIEEPSRILLEV